MASITNGGNRIGIGAGIGSAIQQQVGPATNDIGASQDDYDKYVNNALGIIYPEGERGQMSSAIQRQLSGQFTPEQMQVFAPCDPPLNLESAQDRIAATAVLVTMALEGSAEQAGKQLDDSIVMQGGLEIVEVLANDGEEAGFFEVDETDIENAFYRALDLYRFISPRVDQEGLTQGFEEIRRADQEGRLGELLPGIDRLAA